MRRTLCLLAFLTLTVSVTLLSGCGGSSTGATGHTGTTGHGRPRAAPPPNNGLSPESLPFETPLIVGDGQNAWPSGGEKVGLVTVSSEGADVCVTYDVTEPGWSMDTAHVYIGEAPPLKSNGKPIPPGQFPFGDDLAGVTEHEVCIPISDVPDPFYFAAHAVACEETSGQETVSQTTLNLPVSVVLGCWEFGVGHESYDLGEVTVQQVDDSLGVSFAVRATYQMEATYLWVGLEEDLQEARTQVWHYPYTHVSLPAGTETDEYVAPVPAEWQPGQDILIVAVADVIPDDGPSGWRVSGYGDQDSLVEPFNCHYYFTITGEDVPQTVCETAWAFGRFVRAARTNPWGWYEWLTTAAP